MPRSASFLPCVCTEAVCCGHPGDPSASPSRPVTCSFGPQQQLVSRPATVRPDPHRRGQCAPSSQQGPGARSRRGFSSAAIQTLCRRPPAGPLLGSASGHRHPEHCFRSQQLDAQGWSHFSSRASGCRTPGASGVGQRRPATGTQSGSLGGPLAARPSRPHACGKHPCAATSLGLRGRAPSSQGDAPEGPSEPFPGPPLRAPHVADPAHVHRALAVNRSLFQTQE